MWTFLKKVNAKGKDRPTCQGRTLWVCASRIPQDRQKKRTLNMSKNVLVEAGLVKEEDVEYETKRGIIWIGRERIAEWNAAEEKVTWIMAALRRAGITVESKILDDAVHEKMDQAV